MPKQASNIYAFGFIIVFVLALVVLVYGVNSYVFEMQAQNTSRILSEVVEQQSRDVESRFDSENYSMTLLSMRVAKDVGNTTATLEFLRSLETQDHFELFGVADTNGVAILADGRVEDISDRDYFRQALMGEFCLTPPFYSRISDTDIVVSAKPILSENKIVGVVFGGRDINYYNKFLSTTAFDGYGYFKIVDSDGNIIFQSENTNPLELPGNQNANAFSVLAKATFLRGETFDSLRRKLKVNESGSCAIEYNGQRRWLDFKGLSMNGWTLCAFVPDAVISKTARQITVAVGIATSGLLTLLLFCLFLYRRLSHNLVDKLEKVAYYDELTGACNAIKFRMILPRILKKEGRWIFVVLDVDRMKHFNETFGFSAGDELIQLIAQCLDEELTHDEVFARDNEDMFNVLMRCKDDLTLTARLRRICDKVADECTARHSDKAYALMFNLGACVIDNIEESPDIIIDNAKFACGRADSSDRCNLRFYDVGIKAEVLRKRDIENRMQTALENGEFQVYLQPKYHLKTRKVVGCEALVRWISDGNFLSPGLFIPLFEANGFIVKLDFCMFEHACRLIRDWLDRGLVTVPISVNISRLHLGDLQLVEKLSAFADKYSVPRHLLELELTESALFGNEKQIKTLVPQLNDAGFILSMDDFGTGYSSLGMLKDIPVDVIKLDRSFFTFGDDKKRSRYFITKVIYMLKGYGIPTLAEGIETQEQVDMLTDLGCDMVQGFYFARPMPVAEFVELINRPVDDETQV